MTIQRNTNINKLSSRLNKRVTIEQPSQTPDGAGGFSSSWSDFASVWAEIKPISGREKVFATQIEDKISHIITIRYIQGINNRMRLNFLNRIFNIRYIINPMEHNAVLEILVDENISA